MASSLLVKVDVLGWRIEHLYSERTHMMKRAHPGKEGRMFAIDIAGIEAQSITDCLPDASSSFPALCLSSDPKYCLQMFGGTFLGVPDSSPGCRGANRPPASA